MQETLIPPRHCDAFSTSLRAEVPAHFYQDLWLHVQAVTLGHKTPHNFRAFQQSPNLGVIPSLCRGLLLLSYLSVALNFSKLHWQPSLQFISRTNQTNQNCVLHGM